MMRKMIVIGFVMVVASLWVACAPTLEERRGEPGKSEEITPARYGAKYYSFEDVLVPGELNYQPKRSAIYETPKFKMGWMVFTKWRLDPNSLIEFFTYHMERDNWKLLNTFRGKESILNFSKPDKTCTIRIRENWLGKTEVEIRVGPAGEKKM
ncbi:MAG: hypothetical protein ACUVWO_04520 [Thermodesulfobacteriota bacterium]